VIGKTGQGKSALINALALAGNHVHSVAVEGANSENRCTSEITEYSMVVQGIPITVFDSPGLQDRTCMSDIRKMHERCQRGLSLVVYCTKMTNHRLAKDDKVAMRKLTQAFGETLWEYSVIALTFANNELCDRRDDRDDQDSPEPRYDDDDGWKDLLKKRFQGRLKIWEDGLKEFLVNEIKVNQEIVKRIPVVPTGDYRKTKNNEMFHRLPDRESWINTFWEHCHSQMIKDTKFFLEINENTIATSDDTDTIVIDDEIQDGINNQNTQSADESARSCCAHIRCCAHGCKIALKFVIALAWWFIKFIWRKIMNCGQTVRCRSCCC
jgi:hypothetical protein